MKLKSIKKNRKIQWDKSVEALNRDLSKLYLAPSKINGVGVFTCEDIKKGEKMFVGDMPTGFDLPYSYIKKLKKTLKDRILGMFPYMVDSRVDRPKVFIYPPCPFVIYMNHSTDPSYDPATDSAIRDIKAGEEITEDYRQIDGFDKVYKFIN